MRNYRRILQIFLLEELKQLFPNPFANLLSGGVGVGVGGGMVMVGKVVVTVSFH